MPTPESSMPMPSKPRRKPVTSDPDRTPRPGPPRGVTSDPDRGVAVNSGTDPQRPGMPARPAPETSPPGTTAEETSVPTDSFNATHRPPSRGRDEDVEGSGSKGNTDDAL